MIYYKLNNKTLWIKKYNYFRLNESVLEEYCRGIGWFKLHYKSTNELIQELPKCIRDDCYFTEISEEEFSSIILIEELEL